MFKTIPKSQIGQDETVSQTLARLGEANEAIKKFVSAWSE